MVDLLAATDDSRPHSPAARSGPQLAAFMRHCEHATGLRFADQAAFHQFSVTQYRQFWQLFLDWSGVAYDGCPETICRGDEVEFAQFFPDLRLNYVENLLAPQAGRDDEPAVLAYRAGVAPATLTRRQLRSRVVAAATALARLGLASGDRVVAISGNTEQLIVAGLAVLANGATLSTAAPGMGADSILARFQQLAPTVLLLARDETAPAAPTAQLDRLQQLVHGLPSLTHIVVLDDSDRPTHPGVATVGLAELLDELGSNDEFCWPRFPFNHPLFILFSSGTTGPPKCIVHGAGGVLLEHRKEHGLHEDLGPGDRLFFHTSPSWMMWNWQLSALASGAAIVLFDGPVAEPGTLWSIVDAAGVTAFGTGPSYLRFCETQRFCPREEFELAELRLIMSTGAILRDSQFDWIAEQVKPVPIHSISGGTDIVGCFVLGNPLLPVRPGETQCRSLGLDVRSLGSGVVGELVCANPFPSRPLGLHGDPSGRAFHDAYFAANEGVWTHGDLIEITEHGSARMHGRSDGVLNVGGVRIGPSEIYRVVNSFPGISESLAIEQLVADAIERSRLVLLVVMTEPGTLAASTEMAIRHAIASGTSPAHVPRLIVEVPDLPRTYSGKASEAAVRDALNAVPVRNLTALENPHCLKAIVAATATADARRVRAVDAVAPDSEAENIEAVLCAIFAELLGVAPVGPEDNFFDLGGTSLALATARRVIFERLGQDVPLSAIFLAPQPRALAKVLQRPEQQLLDMLVPLKPGSADARPIFMVHDSSGDVLAYARLATRMSVGRPSFGVRARMLQGKLAADRTIGDMADAAVASVRAVQPSGPYTLLGFSFGGIVAFEMARRLVKAGEEIDQLILLDSYLSPRALGRLGRLRFVCVSRPLAWSAALCSGRRETALRAGRRKLRRLLAADQPTGPPDGPPRTPLADAAARLAHEQMQRYRPAPLASDVVFFQAAQQRPFQCNPVPVWRRATRGRFTVLTMAGGHIDSLAEPNVDEVALRIDALLAAPTNMS